MKILENTSKWHLCYVKNKRLNLPSLYWFPWCWLIGLIGLALSRTVSWGPTQRVPGLGSSADSTWTLGQSLPCGARVSNMAYMVSSASTSLMGPEPGKYVLSDRKVTAGRLLRSSLWSCIGLRVSAGKGWGQIICSLLYSFHVTSQSGPKMDNLYLPSCDKETIAFLNYVSEKTK